MKGYVPKIKKERITFANEMILQGDGKSYESCRSMNQDLTFSILKEETFKRNQKLGSGIRNIKKYAKIYSDFAPTFREGDVFKTIIKIASIPVIKIENRGKILQYLSNHAGAKVSDISNILGLKPSRTRDYLTELIAEGIIAAEGSNRNRTYKLK